MIDDRCWRKNFRIAVRWGGSGTPSLCWGGYDWFNFQFCFLLVKRSFVFCLMAFSAECDQVALLIGAMVREIHDVMNVECGVSGCAPHALIAVSMSDSLCDFSPIARA